jgi:hypothetical protein
MPDEPLRDEERRAREETLKGASLADSVGECRKLIKDLERSRYKAEAIQVGYFASLSLFSLSHLFLSLISRSLTSFSLLHQVGYFAVPVDQDKLSDYAVRDHATQITCS